MTRKSPLILNRRHLLAAAGAAGATLAMPSILRAQEKSLKVGVYGGYFKDSFDKNVFPAFTEATGIAVESRNASRQRRIRASSSTTRTVEGLSPFSSVAPFTTKRSPAASFNTSPDIILPPRLLLLIPDQTAPA